VNRLRHTQHPGLASREGFRRSLELGSEVCQRAELDRGSAGVETRPRLHPPELRLSDFCDELIGHGGLRQEVLCNRRRIPCGVVALLSLAQLLDFDLSAPELDIASAQSLEAFGELKRVACRVFLGLGLRKPALGFLQGGLGRCDLRGQALRELCALRELLQCVPPSGNCGFTLASHRLGGFGDRGEALAFTTKCLQID